MFIRSARLSSVRAVLLFAAGVLSLCGLLFAQVPPPDRARIYPSASLSVAHPPGKGVVLEHSSIEVPFFLSVQPGVAGARPTYDLVVCTENSSQCVPFPQVTPPWLSPSGSKLKMDAPAAGQGVPIKLVACVAQRSKDSVLSCGKLLSDNVSSVDISMRVAVSFDSFTILHTRAHQKDTTYYALAGISSGKPAPKASTCVGKLATFVASPFSIFCVGPTLIGDLDDGTHPLNQIRVGEFEWVPGRTNYLTFAFATVNYGQPRLPLSGPVTDMLPITMNRLIGKLTAPLSGVSEDFTAEINDIDGWRGCDGPTAAGAKRIFNFRDPSHQEPTADELTRASGRFSTSSKIFIVPSHTDCGASSKYKVNWTLERTSWRSY